MGEPGRRRRLGMGAVGQLLGVPRLTVWWWVKTGKLHPTGADSSQMWWSEADVHEWALGRPGQRWSGRVPITAWPAMPLRTVFDETVELPGAVALRWQTRHGPVALVWPLPNEHRPRFAQWARQLAPDGEGAVVVVSGGFSLSHGPELRGVLPGIPERSAYEPTWTGLAAVLCQPLPYWPIPLRDRRLLCAWTPTVDETTAMPVPGLDTGSLLTMASTYPETSPASRVLVNLARLAHSQAVTEADHALQLVDESTLDEEQIVVAARPLPVPDAALNDVDSTQRRAGWLELLGRDDDLACRCVREVAKWDAGADLPFGNPEQIDPTDSRWAYRWSQRLIPTSRTAAFELLTSVGERGETLVDPETDAPVFRESDGTLTAAIPQRLPATSPLAELILAGPIWVRTADQTLYPAPRDSYYGISWGYSGSGPGTLALLVDALLDDINAKAPADINGGPNALEALLMRKLPEGTVLTRRQLEAARRGETVIVPVADEDPDEDKDEA